MDKKNDYALDDIVSRAVEMTLTRLGFDMKDPISTQKDINHLRRSREICEMIQNKSITALTVIILSVVSGALWMGLGAVDDKPSFIKEMIKSSR